ncbi:MAG: hypothetical protein ACRDHW_24005, partial [Ktedonobacteraceae bacterium]
MTTDKTPEAALVELRRKVAVILRYTVNEAGYLLLPSERYSIGSGGDVQHLMNIGREALRMLNAIGCPAVWSEYADDINVANIAQVSDKSSIHTYTSAVQKAIEALQWACEDLHSGFDLERGGKRHKELEAALEALRSIAPPAGHYEITSVEPGKPVIDSLTALKITRPEIFNPPEKQPYRDPERPQLTARW